eukprot:485561_1
MLPINPLIPARSIPVKTNQMARVAGIDKTNAIATSIGIDWSPNNMYIIASRSDFNVASSLAYIQGVDGRIHPQSIYAQIRISYYIHHTVCKTEEYEGAIDDKQASRHALSVHLVDLMAVH